MCVYVPRWAFRGPFCDACCCCCCLGCRARVQGQLWTDLDHASFSGVEVMKALNRTRGASSQAVAPCVSTPEQDVALHGTTVEEASLWTVSAVHRPMRRRAVRGTVVLHHHAIKEASL